MSTIKANDIQNASGGIPTVKGQKLICTAWVNFSGSNTTTIRDSENVSSITDVSSGNYTANFTVAMTDTNYVQNWSAGSGQGAGNYFFPTIFYAPTTAGCGTRILNINSSSTSVSPAPFIMLVVFGGQ